jgi:uncharacterized RDD family membrane protein YckC
MNLCEVEQKQLWRRFVASNKNKMSEEGINELEKAGIGARFASFIVDVIVVFLIPFSLGMLQYLPVFGGTFSSDWFVLLALIITFGYFPFFFGREQTVGMKLAGIKLCGVNGAHPGFLRGLVRFICMFTISQLFFCLGYLWMLGEKGRAWHDILSGTYVVKVK